MDFQHHIGDTETELFTIANCVLRLRDSGQWTEVTEEENKCSQKWVEDVIL